MFIGMDSRSEGVKEARDEAGDAIFICRFERDMFFSEKGRSREICFIAFWFRFLRFQSLIRELEWEMSEGKSVPFYYSLSAVCVTVAPCILV